MLLFVLEEENISLYLSLSSVKKKDQQVSIQLYSFISFPSWIHRQLNFTSIEKWKGSGLLSELEERVHAHLYMECVLFVGLFNLLLGNLYLFNSKYSWRA